MLAHTHTIPTIGKPRRQVPRPLLMRVIAGVVLFVFVTVALHGDWRIAIALLGGGLGIWWYAEALRQHRERDAVLQDLTTLSDSAFLYFIADLLRTQGYEIVKIGQAHDVHGNVFLTCGDRSITSCVLRPTRAIGAGELRRILARMQLSGGKGAMVVTTCSVSWRAARFARRVGCTLVDREELVRLTGQYRQGHRVYPFHRQESVKLRRRK